MSRARAGALASDSRAEAAAAECLAAGGGALEAALAGFFVAGALHPGVLLSPLGVLVAGVGEGGRYYDGRPRQPGLGIKRPRGFADVEAVPAAARVAVSMSLASVLFAHAYASGRSLRSLLDPAVASAKRAGATRRAALLERIAEVGAAALTEAAYRRPFQRLGGPSEGGLVTPSDLEPPELAAEALLERSVAGFSWLLSPEHADSAAETASAVLAVDAQGVFAAVAYRPLIEGANVDELELVAPVLAVPVLRGVTRVAPGQRLGPGFALGVRLDERTRPLELAFEPTQVSLAPATPEIPRLALRRDPETRHVTPKR